VAAEWPCSPICSETLATGSRSISISGGAGGATRGGGGLGLQTMGTRTTKASRQSMSVSNEQSSRTIIADDGDRAAGIIRQALGIESRTSPATCFRKHDRPTAISAPASSASESARRPSRNGVTGNAFHARSTEIGQLRYCRASNRTQCPPCPVGAVLCRTRFINCHSAT
jgi:hypothetical protein